MNQKSNKWQANILAALEKSSFDSSDLIYRQSIDDSGKGFMEQIAQKKDRFEYLDNLNLANTGLCPITGKPIQNSFQYSIFGRTIFLSQEGSQICEQIRRQDMSERGVDYDDFKQQKSKVKSQVEVQTSIISALIWVISFVGSYYLINPDGFLSFIFFLLIGYIGMKVLWYITLIFVLPILFRK